MFPYQLQLLQNQLKITWMKNCPGIGLDVEQPRTWLLHIGHQEARI
jgi:hypothetical protein